MSTQSQPAHDQRTSPGDVHRRVVQLHADGRFDEALLLIDPEAVDHIGGAVGDQHGREAWRAKWAAMDERFAGVSMTVEDHVENDDLSVNRYTVRGTDLASGRDYQVVGMDMVRVRDGKLVEHWGLLDSAALRHQLATDSPAGSDTDPRGA